MCCKQNKTPRVTSPFLTSYHPTSVSAYLVLAFTHTFRLPPIRPFCRFSAWLLGTNCIYTIVWLPMSNFTAGPVRKSKVMSIAVQLFPYPSDISATCDLTQNAHLCTVSGDKSSRLNSTMILFRVSVNGLIQYFAHLCFLCSSESRFHIRYPLFNLAYFPLN